MSSNLSPAPIAASADDFPMDGLPLPFFRELIDGNGGEAAFEGLTTSNVNRLELQLQEQMQEAAADGQEEEECKMMNALGSLFGFKGEYDCALPLYQECLEKRKRILGDDHPDTLASINNLAALFRSKCEYDHALPLYEECLEKRKRMLGDDHPDTLWSQNAFAFVLFLQGECARALPLLDQSLAKAKVILGDNHSSTKLFQTRRDNCALKLAGA